MEDSMKTDKCLIMVVCVIALLGFVVGCGGGSDNGNISITKTEVTAPSTFLGGPVTVRVEATAEGGISNVKVDVTDAVSKVVQSATLSYLGVRYAGSVTIPSNSTANERRYDVLVTVTDNGGHTSTSNATFGIPAPTAPPPGPF
jgi:hypothetical protein